MLIMYFIVINDDKKFLGTTMSAPIIASGTTIISTNTVTTFTGTTTLQLTRFDCFKLSYLYRIG